MKKRLRLICLVLTLALMLAACGDTAEKAASQNRKTLSIWFPQIGKADAALIWSQDVCVLIDAGEKGDAKTILAKMEELNIPKIDVMIITHFDKDHVGGAAKILRSISVDRVLQSTFAKEENDYEYNQYLEALEKAGLQAETLTADLKFSLGDLELRIKVPRQDHYDKDESNNFSLITELVYGEKSFTFLGDAENERLKEYIKTSPPVCDFVKMPHHGEWIKALKDLIPQLKPAYAVITCSAALPENDRTAELLKDCRTEMYLTRNGDLLVECDGRRISITQSAAP